MVNVPNVTQKGATAILNTFKSEIDDVYILFHGFKIRGFEADFTWCSAIVSEIVGSPLQIS